MFTGDSHDNIRCFALFVGICYTQLDQFHGTGCNVNYLIINNYNAADKIVELHLFFQTKIFQEYFGEHRR